MEMKKLLLTLLLSVLAVSMHAVCVDGIYYYLKPDHKATVKVETVWNEDFTSYEVLYYKGDLVIPSTFVFEGETYTVDCVDLYGCEELTSVTLPETIEEIAECGFYGCSALTGVELPSSLKKIGRSAFSYSGLKEITIPSSVKTIGAMALSTRTLEKVYIPDLLAWCNTDIEMAGNVGYIFSTEGNLSIYMGSDKVLVKNLVIPNEITTVKPNLFRDFVQLTEVTFHEKVDSIGTNAFKGCTGLERINISDLKAWCHMRFGNSAILPNGMVQDIGNPLYYANALYMDGEELTVLDIPEGTERIGEGAFMNCKGVTRVNLPSTLRRVDYSAFLDCINIITVSTPSLRDYCNIEYASMNSSPLTPNKTTAVQLHEGESADIAENLVIPAGVTEIKPYAFAGNLPHHGLSIPPSVKKIGAYAFYNGLYLNNLNIMGHVTEIAENAFGNCTGLSIGAGGTIHVYDGNPAAISEMAFYNTRGGAYGPYPADCIYSCPLYVPTGTKAKYEQTTGWSLFKEIHEFDVELPTEVSIPTWEPTMERFTLDGLRVDEQRRGLLIVRQGDGKIKKVLRK
jgi:hypothetical protein